MTSNNPDDYAENYLGQRIAYVDRGSERLIVSMQTFRNGLKFMAGNGLMNKSSYNLLFLTNPNNDYYSDAVYFEILNKFLPKYEKKNILFFGSSMSGYAALRFSYHFGACFFVNNPQADMHLTLRFAWDGLRKEIEKFDYRGDVFDAFAFLSEPFGYYCHGQHPLDKENARFYFEKISKLDKSFVIRDVVSDDRHSFIWKDFSHVVKLMKNILDVREIDFLRRSDAGKFCHIVPRRFVVCYRVQKISASRSKAIY